jgi:hypothetical protein
MKQTYKILSALSLALLSTTLYGADFQLQNIRAGGTGCPTETTQIVLAPDSSAASIIFAQFESRVPNLAVGPKVQRNISTLNCNIFLDIKVPAGTKLDSIDISYDMRGFATFDKGVQGSFKSYLMSKTGLGTEQNSRNPELLTDKSWTNSQDSQEEDFTITTAKTLMASSQCGQGPSDIVSIRLQNTLSSQILAGAQAQNQGSITMDTSDIKGGLKLRAHGSACILNSPGNPPRRNNSGRTCRIVTVNGRVTQECTTM